MKPQKKIKRSIIKEPTKFPIMPTGTHFNVKLHSLEYMQKHQPKRLKRIMKRSK